MRRLGIRWQLSLWYGVFLSLLLLVFSGAVLLLMRHHLLTLTDAALNEELADLAGDIRRCPGLAEIPGELGVRYASHDGYEFQVSDGADAILFRSDQFGAVRLPVPDRPSRSDRPIVASLSLDRLGRWRVASRRIVGPSETALVIQAAISLRPNDTALRELATVLLLAGPLALSGALGGGYWLARQTLAPVDRMVATASEISASRLDRRLDAPNARDELGRLAATFNEMFARLQRSFEETRRFTADAAHELRTPLAVMRTEAEVALRAPRSPERDGRVLEDLLEEIDRLTRLVSQLLFLCREDSGVGEGEFRPVRVDELIRDVAEHMQVAAREKDVELRAVPASSACLIRGAPDRLRQLLFNLLDNAIKFTAPGGIVSLEGESLDGKVRVVVADTGIGIPAEHLPRVFERFYRVDPARGRDTEGTGLGLAICRSIVEAHQGQIQIESVPRRGTRVIFDLPAAQSSG